MTEPGHLPEAEFQQIEEFISRTPRGREFLREHMRRAQTGVAEEVRVLVSDLRDLWRQQADANNLVNRVQVLRHELQDMSASISQARREIGEQGGTPHHRPSCARPETARSNPDLEADS